MRCPICLNGRTFHDMCLSAALTWIAHGGYDAAVQTDLARTLAPTCYLCGAAKTEHADHVTPRYHGGVDTWDNIGGACQPCNRTKWHRPRTLTTQQDTRLAQQQAAYRAAYSRTTPDIVAKQLLIEVRSETWDILPPDTCEVAEAIEDHLQSWIDDDYHVDLNDGRDIVITFESGATLTVFP